MKILRAVPLLTLMFGTAAQADDVTYRKDIRPLWEKQCMACHGDASALWVSKDGWVLKRFKDLSREELGRMKVEE